MKKRIIILGLTLIMLFSFNQVFANEDNKEESKEVKIITVGYDIDDQKEIFGDMSDKEIWKYLFEKADKLMDNEYSNDLNNLNNKLIITISSNIKKNKILKSNKLNSYKPKSPDEILVTKTFRYIVAFSIGPDRYPGGYETEANGIISKVGDNYMDSIKTTFQEGFKWPVTDHDPVGQDAYNTFINFYDVGSSAVATGHFTINDSGTLKFHGVD